jgi:hypothetical protein
MAHSDQIDAKMDASSLTGQIVLVVDVEAWKIMNRNKFHNLHEIDLLIKLTTSKIRQINKIFTRYCERKKDAPAPKPIWWLRQKRKKLKNLLKPKIKFG